MTASSGNTRGVHGTAEALASSLRSYIEAQYHIHDEATILERRALLENPGAIGQVPYVESTPIYELGLTYEELNLPNVVRSVLKELSEIGVGVFERPYVHQARALEEFFGNPSRDLIIATGTGSGKTESFLMPIIGHLAMESARSQHIANMPGCRALLLYPMNALVNDQNSRVRRLFGSDAASAIISAGRDRPVRFATYTSRTPYPGPRTARRDAERIAPLFDSFYLPFLERPEKLAKLRAIGQWPAKDLEAFFGSSLEETQSTRAGDRRIHHWDHRLKTQDGDRELLTRHEVQAACPDILITNYSMLEYMLMRPIERPIFSQTRDWLKADDHNQLIVVLDEAHMYRGAGGAEVALLLRRLAARLEVSRERVRYVLTSASLGDGPEAKDKVQRFGSDLTGLSAESPRNFTLILGQHEHRAAGGCGDASTAGALASLDLAAFEHHAGNLSGARAAVRSVARQLRWENLQPNDDLADYLFRALTGFPPLELLIELVSGRALPLPELEVALFPACVDASDATASLLALATFAKRAADGRVLLPTRLHMLFRGLPGLFACVDPGCSHKRVSDLASAIIGRLHTHMQDACGCGARVYEFLTHRECGAAFLRGYLRGAQGDFLWHIPSGQLHEENQSPLIPADILIEGEPHSDQMENCVEAWLDIKSGRLVYESPTNGMGFRKVYLPDGNDDFGRSGLRFKVCPVCGAGTLRENVSAIMDHATKGEAPFANLVKTQLEIQPATREEDRAFPNGGRKVLLFSDGRQKAARLARDIPREVEQDIFRQVLALAAKRLCDIGQEAKLGQTLYKAVLTVLRDFNLPLFDRADAVQIEHEIERIEKDHEGENLADILAEFEPSNPPPRYSIALLKQLCGRYYSFTATTIGYLGLRQRTLGRAIKACRSIVPSLSEGRVEELALSWIAHAAERYALDRDLSQQLRAKAAGFWTDTPGIGGQFRRDLRAKLPTILEVELPDVEKFEHALCEGLALADQGGGYLADPSKLQILIALDKDWYRCTSCKSLRPFRLGGCCSACGTPNPEKIDPTHNEYIRARKGFWRRPVQLALSSQTHLRGISVEEHTAQLSNRDKASIYATTDQYELRFRDILINSRDRPIDVLSCTTTMEVGVDIGSLVAVGLRNVPPQRENYQQRAGRAGRRGSSVSSVVTFAQTGPHDNYYYHKPAAIVAGSTRNPDVKTNNPKIARRHINSFLIQTFFHRYMDEHQITIGGRTSALFRALGMASDFYHGNPERVPTFDAFVGWLRAEIAEKQTSLRQTILAWLPSDLRTAPLDHDAWISSVVDELVLDLRLIGQDVHSLETTGEAEAEEGGRTSSENPELLDLLFNNGLLPTYAFPTDLTSFLIEKFQMNKNSGRRRVEIVERPQQGIQKALTEYAPGRLIVINKETYRSGGVVADALPTTVDRAAELFEKQQTLLHCDNCNYVGNVGVGLEVDDVSRCPVCSCELQISGLIVPQVFTPEDARALDEDDRDQELTYATGAQFPVPIEGEEPTCLNDIGEHASFTVARDQRLVMTNRGQLSDGSFSGFWICERCGRASLTQPTEDSHTRPYPVEFAFGVPRPSPRCKGSARNVFLGHVFTTDLLLLRIDVSYPLNTNTHDSVSLRALEDGLYSIAEAVRLSATRHPHLDLDASELGSGFRIVPKDDNRLHLDIYMFDTLSGGAGYSELAGQYLEEILADALELLEHCPESCDRSCESCLRHYHNQYLKHRLDRRLGALLLRYGVSGDVPQEREVSDQIRILEPLGRLLELDGFDCKTNVQVDGVGVPLAVRRGTQRILLGTTSCLVREQAHALHRLSKAHSVVLLNDYVLPRNLPDEHRLVRGKFPK